MSLKPQNDFKAFSISNNANVVSQERYEESRSLKTGFPPDNVTTHELNKVLRQSSTISSVVANFIATHSGGDDVLDDGDIAKLTAQLNRALEKKITTEIPSTSLTQKGIVQLTDQTGNSDTLAVTQKLASDINDNANNKLAKDRNGADIPDKNEFVKNLGLVETVNKAQGAYPKSGGVLDGNVDAVGSISGKGVYEYPSIRVYSAVNKPSPGELGAFPAVVSVTSIPGRSFLGPFSTGRAANWAKGINITQSSDVGQIYITADGVLHAYFLNSNGDVAGGTIANVDGGVKFITGTQHVNINISDFTTWIKSLSWGGHAFRFGGYDGTTGYPYSCGYVTRCSDTWAGFVADYGYSGISFIHGNDGGGVTRVSKLWTDKNATPDTNGFLKKSSPIVEIHSDGSFTTNDESKGATVERLSEGVYLVSGTLGFNADAAWGGIDGGIEIPLCKNKLPLIWVDYEVMPDGAIKLMTYHREHPDAPVFARNMREGYANGDLIDIPLGRFVSVRVQMPGADDEKLST
ncbi:phage tail protein [Photorhabdus tasmaniensis]